LKTGIGSKILGNKKAAGPCCTRIILKSGPISAAIRGMKRLFPLIYALTCLIVAHSFAGSATWNVNPISRDWNTAENWTPNTVPTSATDIATFNTSAVRKITLTIPFSISINYLASMIFNPGADSFSFHVVRAQNVQINGDGIVNNSGKVQEFVLSAGGSIYFNNTASCGDLTNYAVVHGGAIYMFSQATAATAHFTASDAGYIFFTDQAQADHAIFDIAGGGRVTIEGGSAGNAVFNVAGGYLEFILNGTADQSVIDCSAGGQVNMTVNNLPLGSPQITAHGATLSGHPSGHVNLVDGSADHATFIIEGGTSAGARGGSLNPGEYSDLENAQVTVTGGTSGGYGGTVFFSGRSTGGNASMTMSGNACLDMTGHDPASALTVGSLAGAGSVSLGTSELSIGTNNLSTTFSGLIQDTGSVRKLGTGTLTLSGANTYAGITTVSAGALRVSNPTGSATGTSTVRVDTGTLGGGGIIAGPVTVGVKNGTGAFLAPGLGASEPKTLILQSAVNFKADGTYTYKLNTSNAKADQVIANGTTITGNAQFSFDTVGNDKLTAGTVFTAISNTATTPISGTFANLADGSTVTLGVNKLQASYSGGDGNDLTLTVVP